MKTHYTTLITKYNEDARRWNDNATALKGEIQRLSKWKAMADAEVKAAEMVRTARAMFEKAKADADGMISTAQRQAASALAEASQKAETQLAEANSTATAVASEAKERAKALKEEAQWTLSSATTQAASITTAANKKGRRNRWHRLRGPKERRPLRADGQGDEEHD